MTAAEYVPERTSLPTLREGVQGCRGCAEHVVATVHPSSILRQRDGESRKAELVAFVQGPRVVAKLV